MFSYYVSKSFRVNVCKYIGTNILGSLGLLLAGFFEVKDYCNTNSLKHF